MLAHRLSVVARRTLGTPVTPLVLGLLVLAAVETVGRRSARSDVHDLVAALFLVLAAFFVHRGLRDRARPLASRAAAARRRVTDWFRRFRYDVGVDLRGHPPIRRGVPSSVLLLIVGPPVLAMMFTGIGLVAARDPRAVAGLSYLVHLMGLIASWALLTSLTVLLTAFGTLYLHDFFQTRLVAGRPGLRRVRSLCYLGGVASIGLGAWLLPSWVPFALLLTADSALLAVVWSPWTPTLTMLWKRPRGRVAACDCRWMQTREISVLLFGILSVFALVFGPAMLGFGPEPRGLAVTRALWVIAAWTTGVASAVVSGLSAGLIIEGVRNDPGRPSPLTVHVDGTPSSPESLRQMAARRGWRLRFSPAPPMPLDVPVRLVPEITTAEDLAWSWPLPVSERGLESSQLETALLQQDLARRREALVAGADLLLLYAARRSYEKGTGFWFGPHLWFVPGLQRDTDEEAEDGSGSVIPVVGPLFKHVFPGPARHHFRLVMNALDLDLVYVEDGIRPDQFGRVLRRLFAHYDARDSGRLEDRHLSGLTGVKAIVHEYELEEPFKKKGYPEPDYEDLARARILHVFRDRGEDEDTFEDPIDLDALLSPTPVG